jgi:predicted DNA-binding protein with PD1-like motif
MQKFLLVLILVVAVSFAAGRQIRIEVVRAAATSEDLKANSDTVANAYALFGQFDRVVVVRCKHRSYLLEGLEEIVKAQNIYNAVVLSGIGSVRGYHFHVVGNRTFPTENIFVKDTTAPADIAGMSGYVIDGRIHAHIMFANAEKAFGGHLEPGTEVYTFAIVTLGILKDGIDLSRVDDKNYR